MNEQNQSQNTSIPELFLKPYEPKNHEKAIYELWEQSGFFNPDNLPNNPTEPFLLSCLLQMQTEVSMQDMRCL